MTTILNPFSRTLHLPTRPGAEPEPQKSPDSTRKGLRLTDLESGETGRILRISLPDTSCRKRFAELGLIEGMKVTVASTGDTLMLIVGGARMGVSAHCAEEIHVHRVAG